MKAALLHYWLTNVRGGEKVLAALGEMLPEADVFTHAYVRGNMEGLFDGRKVTESFIASMPFGRKHPQAYLPLMPAASRSLKLDGYELVVSSESGPIKGVRKPKGARHVCYCHTPMRYLGDMHDEYFRTAGIGGKLAMKLFTPYLRREDLKSAESVDEFVANSVFVAERIKRIYGRDSVVVHPPVDVEFFSAAKRKAGDYYLYVGELRDYKRPDLAVAATLRMNRNLIVVGNGKQCSRLECEVGGRSNVVFAGRMADEKLRGLYAGAKALLFPGLEDFGIGKMNLSSRKNWCPWKLQVVVYITENLYLSPDVVVLNAYPGDFLDCLEVVYVNIQCIVSPDQIFNHSQYLFSVIFNCYILADLRHLV